MVAGVVDALRHAAIAARSKNYEALFPGFLQRREPIFFDVFRKLLGWSIKRPKIMPRTKVMDLTVYSFKTCNNRQ